MKSLLSCLPFSCLPSSSLLPSLFSFLPSPPLPFPSLSPFPPFPLRRKRNHKHNHKHYHIPNTEPPTHKIPLRLLSSTPIPSTPQKTSILPPYTSKNKKYTTAAESIPRNIQVYTPTTYMFSTYITKEPIVLQPSQQTLLQQDCRVTFSGSSGSSSRRKSQSIYCTCNHIYVFLLFFYFIKQKGNTKMKRNSLNFSVLYLLSRNISCDRNNNGDHTTQADVSLFWP